MRFDRCEPRTRVSTGGQRVATALLRAVITAAALIPFVSTYATDTQQFLVPIYLSGPTKGAFDTRWVSELTILNTGDTLATIENYGPCNLHPCLPGVIPPRLSLPGVSIRFRNPSIPGALLIINSEYVDQLEFQARVRDVSRAEYSLGTWLPVVHESEARRDSIVLLDVPLHGRYRSMLRIYSFDLDVLDRQVRVRVFGSQTTGEPTDLPDPLLAELTVMLRFATDNQPLYAEVVNLASVLGTIEHDRVWLEITPYGELGVWGMVSVTNNATQEVTMVLPNK